MSFIDGPLPRDIYKRPLKKRRRILPAGGLGVSPSFKKSHKIGGLGVNCYYFSSLIMTLPLLKTSIVYKLSLAIDMYSINVKMKGTG